MYFCISRMSFPEIRGYLAQEIIHVAKSDFLSRTCVGFRLLEIPLLAIFIRTHKILIQSSKAACSVHR